MATPWTWATVATEGRPSTATDFVTEAVLQDEETGTPPLPELARASRASTWTRAPGGLLRSVRGTAFGLRLGLSAPSGEGRVGGAGPRRPSRQGRPIRAEDAKDSERVLRSCGGC